MPAILDGNSPCQHPQGVPRRGYLFMGMTPKVKTVSCLSLKFPVYGMFNENDKTPYLLLLMNQV